MYRTDGGLVVSPTDLTKFLACEHLTALDVQVALGTRPKPFNVTDELLQLLFEKGRDHEKRYLDSLLADSQVVQIAETDRSPSQRAADTEAAIHSGAEVIYQAAFLHAGRVGYADFLLRSDRPSVLGDWSYDVADTKLARRLKVPALLQMATYGEHLRRVQGRPPQTLTVVAGDGEQHEFAFTDIEAYARRVTARFDAFVADPGGAVPEPVEHCEQCRWVVQCTKTWRAADHLSFVAFLGRRQRNLIEDSGITTMAALGTATVVDLPRGISRRSRERIGRQASLQLQERADDRPHYELLDLSYDRDGTLNRLGLLALTEPDPGDLYLDFESDRWVEPDGLEYLAGVGDTEGTFTPLWAHSPAQEKALTEDLVDRILTRWHTQPGMHVYHYASYAQSALKRLAHRHTTREAELDILLRAQVFIDLYAVVRQGLIVSKESYSIKKLEAFYWGAERRQNTEVAEALSSVLAYEQWLQDGKQEHLDGVQAYNKDDADSTRALHRWLEDRRTDLSTQHGFRFDRPSLAVLTGVRLNLQQVFSSLSNRTNANNRIASPAPVTRQQQQRLTTTQVEQLVASYDDGASMKSLAAEFTLHRTTVASSLRAKGGPVATPRSQRARATPGGAAVPGRLVTESARGRVWLHDRDGPADIPAGRRGAEATVGALT